MEATYGLSSGDVLSFSIEPLTSYSPTTFTTNPTSSNSEEQTYICQNYMTIPNEYGTTIIETMPLPEPKTYNISDVKRALTGAQSIMPRFRIFVLNPDDSVKYKIPDEDIKVGGSYSENYQNGQRRSLSFSLNNQEGKYTPSIDTIWTNSRFSLDIGIVIPDTEMVVWFKKGVFVANKVDAQKTTDGYEVSVQCGDKFQVLESKQGTLTDTTTIAPGIRIKDVIQDILSYNNGDGNPLDYKSFVYHSSFEDKLIPIEISENAGSTYGALILQLADILSAEVFYNAVGELTFIPMVETSDDNNKPAVFSYWDNDRGMQEASFSFDFSQVVNRVAVIGASDEYRINKAIAVNDDAASPICVQRIGYRTGQVINDNNITSDILAQERADYELRKQIILKTSFNSSVIFNPLLEVNNIVTLTDSFYGLIIERLLLQSVSFSLDYGGTMSFTAANVRNLPFTI